jgi:hypothetical protein
MWASQSLQWGHAFSGVEGAAFPSRCVGVVYNGVCERFNFGLIFEE